MKHELGYNVVGVGAEVYVAEGYIAIFDKAVQPYLIDLSTTSSTVVPSAGSQAITLATNPAVVGNSYQPLAYVVGSSLIVDIGPQQETCIVTALSGLVATMTFALTHSGTYPIILNGAEQMIRNLFVRIDGIETQLTSVAPVTAGIAALTGEVELFSSSKGRRSSKSKFDDLLDQRDQSRREIAELVGVPYLRGIRNRSAGTSYELY